MAANVHLLIVDPQNDFCDPKGALYVKGADRDMERLGALIVGMSERVEAIHVTMDAHHLVDVAHPIFWVDSRGNHPEPFTIITAEDVEKGRYTPTDRSNRDRSVRYVRALAENGRYPLCIWPPHCLIGSWGANVYDPVLEALLHWEKRLAVVDYITKGTNPWTEHYSAIRADVPDVSDPTTLPNIRLIEALKSAHVVAVAGEALSHCVANTLRDLADVLSRNEVRKMVLLGDCTSPVPGFEKVAETFLKEAIGTGVRVATSGDFLAERLDAA